MSSKNQKSPCSEAKGTCSDMITEKETNWKLLRHRRRQRGCPFFFNLEFGDPNPVAPQRTVWQFLHNTSVSEQKNISQAIRYCLPPLQFLQVQTKHSIHRQVRIPNISWWCENCPEWKEASNCYRQRWGRLTLKLCLSTMSSFKLRLSLDTDLIHISIKKVLFDRQKKPFLEFYNQQLLLSDSVTKRFWSFI